VIETPTNGPMAWQLIRSTAAVSYEKGDAEFIQISRYYKDGDEVKTGACTGVVSPGDTLLCREYFIIRAKPTDSVGFSVDLKFEDEKIDWRWKSTSDLLSAADKSGGIKRSDMI
jgi:hypothetical protein